MRVTGLSIKNVLGVAEMRIEPGLLTTITGSNGSGKSSVLAALQAAINRGNLANLKRVGTDEEPEVVLVLDDGRYRVERKGDDTVVKERVGDSAAYEKMRRPQAWLDSLFDATMCNPMTFLNARPQDRADILLDVLPVTLDRDALQAAIAEVWPKEKALPQGHPLTVLAEVKTVLFDERTGVNRSQRDKASSAYEQRKALPAELPAEPAAALQEAASARDALFRKQSDLRAAAEVAEKTALDSAQAVYDEVQARVEGAFKAAAGKLRTAEAERIGAVNTELERAIAALRSKAAADIEAIKAATTKDVEAAKAKGEDELDTAGEQLDQAQAAARAARQQAFASVDALQPGLQAAEAKVAELTALSKNVAQLQALKALADQFDRESGELKAVSQRLTEALDAVDVFKAQLLRDLPIQGLEIRGKDIYVGGVAFDQLNTAQRIRLAVKVAVLRAGATTLRLVCVDGAESLDAEQFKLLEDELVASGVQAVVARVDDGPLKVETREGQGGTVGQAIAPQLEEAYKSGRAVPLLPAAGTEGLPLLPAAGTEG